MHKCVKMSKKCKILQKISKNFKNAQNSTKLCKNAQNCAKNYVKIQKINTAEEN